MVYAIKLRTRFRGIDTREGLIWRGSVGWAEWSPFLDYSAAEGVPWLRAAMEAAEEGWPAPVRERVAVNSTIPAVAPEIAHRLAHSSGCRTAKVKVGERGQSLAYDLGRVEADVLGVVDRTFHPAKASMWLRGASR